jgi:hypothetical protein
MKIEEGKRYYTKQGGIVGPMVRDRLGEYPWRCTKSSLTFTDDGMFAGISASELDIVSEVMAPRYEPPCGGKTGAELSAVRTVTRKEIVPGTYGPRQRLKVAFADRGHVFFVVGSPNSVPDGYTPNQVREFARLLTEIADAMEGNG